VSSIVFDLLIGQSSPRPDLDGRSLSPLPSAARFAAEPLNLCCPSRRPSAL
jgi:hypothetical protein